jgi:hypothetical protein
MRRAVVLLAMLMGCRSAAPAAEPSSPTESQAELPIPSDLREQIARSSAIGQQLYMLDKVAALATDVLFAKVQDVGNRGLAGYLPLEAEDDQGKPTGSFLVGFFTSDDPPRVAYEVRVAPNTPAAFEAFTPPKEAPPGFVALARARQLAIAAMPVSQQPVNPVLLPAKVNGETGVLVYLLAGTKRPDVAVLGRHFRALVPTDGTSLTYLMPLSKSPVEIPTRDPFGEPVVGLVVTHLVTDFPLETHVFASLLHKTPIHVLTKRGAWAVDGERVSFLGGKGLATTE